MNISKQICNIIKDDNVFLISSGISFQSLWCITLYYILIIEMLMYICMYQVRTANFFLVILSYVIIFKFLSFLGKARYV